MRVLLGHDGNVSAGRLVPVHLLFLFSGLPSRPPTSAPFWPVADENPVDGREHDADEGEDGVCPACAHGLDNEVDHGDARRAERAADEVVLQKRNSVRSTWRPMKTRKTYAGGNGGTVVWRQVYEQRLRAVHDCHARPANCRYRQRQRPASLFTAHRRALTDDLQNQRAGDIDFRLQTPPIPDARSDIHREKGRHQSQAGVFYREVLLLRDVLGANLPLGIRLHPAYHVALDALILVVEDLARHDAPNQHPAPNGEETKPDVGLVQERVDRLEERRDGRGDAVEDGVDERVEEEQE